MGRTGAECLLEQGEKRDELRVTREVLLDLMTTKFGSFPLAMTYKIKAIRNPRRLDTLLEKGFAADTIEEIGIE